MGKATVNSHIGDALYSITVDYGSEIIAAQIAEIDAQIAARQADLTEAETEANDAQTALDAATAAVDTAIDAYAADPTDANRQAMNEAAAEAARLNTEYGSAEARRQSIATTILSLQADKSQLQDVRTSETRLAWCADRQLSLTAMSYPSGYAGTIEIPGEVGTMVIAPGMLDSAGFGRLVARGAQAPHQAYYNAAILPGWQRFVHPYRVGTLIGKSGNTGTVLLDAATSSAADIQVRDEETITAPIRYLTCDGAAFDAGDRVIVDVREPMIIGFESNPKECPLTVGFPDYLALRAGQSGDIRAQVLGNTRYYVQDGDLETGQTTTFLDPRTMDESLPTTYTFQAECRDLLGSWSIMERPGWDNKYVLWIPSQDADPPESDVDNSPDSYILHSQPSCSAPGNATHYAIGVVAIDGSLQTGYWTYRETAATQESYFTGAGNEIFYWTGDEFKIINNDWEVFWNRLAPPDTVVLIDTVSEQQQAYERSDVGYRRLFYRKVEE